MVKYLIIFFFGFSSFSQEVDRDNLLLWEISGNGLKQKSYLYGSLHSNDRRLFNYLSDSVYYALNQSEVIALETDVFSLFDDPMFNKKNRLKLNYDNNGDPYTSTNTSTNSSYGDEDGMPQFLDAYFEQYCHNAGKKFTPLESAEEQLEAFEGFGNFNLSNLNIETMYMSIDDMIELYLEGDIYVLNNMMKESLRYREGAYAKIIVDRNRNMIESLEDDLKSNSVFCAVGASHLAGGAGMINLLRGKGYTVRSVLAVYSDEKIKAEQIVKSNRSYMFQDDTLKMHVEFPGKPLSVNGIENDEDYQYKLVYKDFGQGNTYVVEVYQYPEGQEMDEISDWYIPSPEESPYECLELDYGIKACEGIADSYKGGVYWVRVLFAEDVFVVIKAFGGNKFMNSSRPFNFFDKVWFE